MIKNKEKAIRVLIGKFQLESHDRGSMLVAQMLRDVGMEVIYINFCQVSEIVNVALQEDVDVIGLSMLAGETHKVFFPELMTLLKKNGLNNILVIAGGRILPEDIPELTRLGVGRVFGPGSTREEIVA